MSAIIAKLFLDPVTTAESTPVKAPETPTGGSAPVTNAAPMMPSPPSAPTPPSVPVSGAAASIGGNDKPLSIAEKSAELIRNYDADGDGRIEIQRGETHRTKLVHDVFTPEEEVQMSYSISSLAGVADRLGNGDGTVTRAELQKALRLYDRGDGRMPSDATRAASSGDGVLSGTEATDFEAQLGEVSRRSVMAQTTGSTSGSSPAAPTAPRTPAPPTGN